MIKRVITSFTMLPVLLILVYLGGWLLKAAILVLMIMSMYEIYKAVSKKLTPAHYLGFLFAVFYMLALDMPNSSVMVLAVLVLFVVFVTMASVFMYKTVTFNDCMTAVFGFFYAGLLLSTIYIVRESRLGMYIVWLIFITAWGCDTGAYFVGISMGRRKLLPAISPKKTVEGSIGGVLSAGLLSALYSLALGYFLEIQVEHLLLTCTTIGVAGGIFAQIGDLSASVIKRQTGIKDFGWVLPGHGGILDRFDSVLFTAPTVFITMLLFEAI